MIKRCPEKIQEALLDFLTKDKLEFFYFFCSKVVWYEDNSRPTMWAGVVDMKLAMGFNTEFLNDLNVPETKYLIGHELGHLIGNHGKRGKGYDHEKANRAMDDIINYMLDKHHGSIMTHPIYTQERHDREMLKDKTLYEKLGVKDKIEEFAKKQIGKPMGCVIDPEYVALVEKGERSMTFEDLYEWKTENNKHKGQSFDIHVEFNELDQDIKDSLVAEAVESAKHHAEKSRRGSMTGGQEEFLNLLLKKPKKNNLKLLKRMVAYSKGSIKSRSYRRLSRRVTGTKGNIKQSQALNVVLDVSGSMWGRFDKVLSEIFKDGLNINLIQADTQVNSHTQVSEKKELKKFKMKGGGGTMMQPAVEYIHADKKLRSLPTILLTDGETDTIDFGNSSTQWLIISCHVQTPYVNGRKVKQVIIEG